MMETAPPVPEPSRMHVHVHVAAHVMAHSYSGASCKGRRVPSFVALLA